jgi:HlyD family secretion protein
MSLETDGQLQSHVKLAKWAMLLVGGSAIFWGGVWPLAGAIVTSGTIVIDGNVKKVQPSSSGIVGALAVREGSYVKEGDIVARLDDTLMRSNLGIVRSELINLRSRLSRLTAERDDEATITFPTDLLERAKTEIDAAAAIASEISSFNSRRTARQGQKAQLLERITQTDHEIESVQQQRKSSMENLAIAKAELNRLQPLRDKGLVQWPRITALEREIARTEGAMGDADARIEQSKGKIRETRVQVGQVDRDRVAEAAKDLREAEAKIAEQNERRTAAEDQLRRVDIKSPATGVVHELSANTVGGTVNQGEAMMLIVPDTDQVVIEAKIQPQDIDQVHIQQSARLRFTSFSQNTTPELLGTVFRISPNTSKDPQTGLTFFTVGVRLVGGQVELLRGARLLPGMAAETYLVTDSRTAISFLLKPLLENFQKIFTGR